jgi:hypothetical protein
MESTCPPHLLEINRTCGMWQNRTKNGSLQEYFWSSVSSYTAVWWSVASWIWRQSFQFHCDNVPKGTPRNDRKIGAFPHVTSRNTERTDQITSTVTQLIIMLEVMIGSGRMLGQCLPIYEGRLKSSWNGGSAPLLCRGRRWLLCQVVVVGVT